MRKTTIALAFITLLTVPSFAATTKTNSVQSPDKEPNVIRRVIREIKRHLPSPTDVIILPPPAPKDNPTP